MTGSFVPFPYFIFHPNSSLHFFFFNSSCTFHLFLWCYSFLVLMGMLSNAALMFSVSSFLSSGSLASGDASIYIFEMFNASVFYFFFCSFHLPFVGWFVFLRTRTGLSTSQTRTINPVFASKLLDSTTLLYWFCVWIACWFQIFHQNYCFTKEALLGFFFNLSVLCRAALQLSIEATLWDNQRWLVNTEKPSQNQ